MSLSEELDLDTPMQDRMHEAVLSVVLTGTMLTQAGTAFFREYDLTEAQFNVLFALHYADHALTQTELGRRLVVTRASITSLIDKLEEKGLVERRTVPGNRRSYHVIRTKKGQALFAEVEPLYRARIHHAMSGLSASEQKQLISLLERVRACLATVEEVHPVAGRSA